MIHPTFLAFGLLEIVLLGLVLAAAVFLALWYATKKLGAAAGTAASGAAAPKPGPTPNPATELQDLVQQAQNEGAVTEAQCDRMRALLGQMRRDGAPETTLGPLEERIRALCGEG